MKICIFCILFMLSQISFAQPLEGVWGLKFYQGTNAVKSYMKIKHNKTPIIDEKGSISYEDCSFAGHNAEYVFFSFYNDSLYQVIFLLTPTEKPKILDLYNLIKSDLTNKYWTPTNEFEEYRYPFSKNDNMVLTAIKGGYTTIGAVWNFPKGEPKPSEGQISMKVTKDLKVVLGYNDAELFYKASTSKKQGELKDY